MTDRSLRIRALLDAQFAVIVAVLVVLALTGGWVVYTTHVEPGTEGVEQTASSWETASEFQHHAVVTAVNPLYEVGSNLTGRSVYFAEVTPRFEGAYEYSYDATGDGELNASVELAVVMRGVEQADRSENVTVVWERTRRLNAEHWESLSPGEAVSVPFSVNATKLANRTGQIEQSLGEPSDETELFLRATVNASGSVNGQSVERSRVHAMALAFGGGTYRVRDAGPNVESFERTETVFREQSYGVVRAAGGPLLLLAGLGGLGVLGVARRRDRIALSAAEHERLAYLDDRHGFDEWISEIGLPPQAFELPTAEASSLGSLVDFAIDTDNGVVEAPDEEAFYVVHDGYLYEYRPPDLDEEEGTESSVEADDPEVVDLDESRFEDFERDVDEEEVPSGVASDGAED
ncbi:DUF5305 domain-containing protein [Halorubellus sp. PRR65]|uniref:DUF5305 domain-containing protein n=1 Tax=Halorubellus sp. PRR65 TaxID=3098148 RepID=UPI002B25CF4E|nr:DUF5305 domain-containing protein [Halorubellus sp. PRR65]